MLKPVNKLSKIKSKFNKLSKKLSNSIQAPEDLRNIFNYFCKTNTHDRSIFESDGYYEYQAFYRNKKSTDKQLTGILINETWNPQQSTITVNSEDLTAKEFADIAGIRILPENEREFTMDSMLVTMSSKRTSISTCSIKQPHIWDSEFWTPQSIMLPLSRNNSNPPILHELRQTNNKKIIKKGRFEIQLDGYS
ncbi:uncharacterized protein B0P05DRAFT_588513 [Gilbertella persicaria]|uniref:uncharacterized protein n=1 Tax=Gilbertella persicaria TaxID=101096 RepID=UPI00221F966F|nr:uncharacterized protein B0P05DRAFT_588513 [Gilbertella persicaria]KAI8075481.1 hypothetical protein B0P05DRAFT_588513 [Gilbertella persicaria]